ncbi:MAG: type I DNA topoisomerase [Flavobacteriales bacterium]|nr:type I DNA topoisomerase [Flavobacteriales bacterium]
MAKNLVIVESPAKAKTIEGFLGKDYIVKSCFGHVRDLAGKGLAIDVDNNFEPTYAVSEEKQKVVDELKKYSKKAETIWLATDEDREGEAISWHLLEALELKEEQTKRIVFHEITKKAILNAIESPRKIDTKLVDAQQARRVLDRLVGFELSPILWKKIKPSLSAGRVQSVAVRIIVEREQEIIGFDSKPYFRVVANFNLKDGAVLKAELPKKLETIEEAKKLLEECTGSSFTIQDIDTRPGKKTPSAPFTTSTLQQEASRKLGFSVSQTMTVAQKLYEEGKITYMRTDSVNLSQDAIDGTKDAIIKNYGSDYANPKQYINKNKSAQEAHEAIRPTEMHVNSYEGDSGMERLYDLIWKRTISSQMSDAQLERTTVKINISNSESILNAQGEVLIFDGFLKVYLESKEEEDEEIQKGMLPPLSVEQVLDLDELISTERFTHHPARYTEASLVKKMEEQGIGRPSTYAPTISTIQKRGYVEKKTTDGKEREYRLLVLKDDKIEGNTQTEITGAEKNKLFPTDIGIVVNDFLVEHFENVMDYTFTARVEKEFDEIARGEKQWNTMVKEFYLPFHKDVETTLETAERASGERELGVDPKSGRKVITRIGRYGPMVQIGNQDEEEKPKFAKLQEGQHIASITFDEAMDLFKLPRDLGAYEEKDMVVAIGRFGPYVRHNSLFFSIPKDEDPYTIEGDRCIEIIEAKRKADREKLISSFDEEPDLQVLNGRWGSFIKKGKLNYKIPKDKEAADLTLEECLDIIKNAPPPKKKRKK